MKIWILTLEFPPHFGGGIGTYVENVANMYADNGDKVKVIVRDDEDKIEESKNGNLQVCRFTLKEDENNRYMGQIQSIAYQYYQYILQLLEQGEKPDIIEIQEYNAIGYYIFQQRYIDREFLKDIPVVVHLHTPQFALFDVNKFASYKLPDYWIGQLERYCIKAADAILCPSQFLKEKLKDINTTKEIKVIPLPFESSLEDESLENVEMDEDLFVYFGRKEYRKGVKQMVETFEKLWQEGEKCKLKLIGGDTVFFPKNEFLGEMLEKKYQKRVQEGLLIFQPNTPPDILKKDIKQARAVLVPSLYENFPNTCLMSMWLGKVVIASKQGGQAEMVAESGVNGYIFDHDIPNDMYEKVKLVWGLSKEKLGKIGKNAQKRIYAMCNVQNNLKLRKDFFKEVIAQKKQEALPTKYPFLNDTSKYQGFVKTGKNPCLSVVIPYYNMGAYLDDAVQSILDSTYKNNETIIVNDGSTEEKSIEALEKYRHQKGIMVIDIPNGGLANARNVGAEHAKGEYIAFLDPDDMVEKTMYEKAIRILSTYENVSYVFSFVRYFGANDGGWTTFDTQLPYLLCHNMLNANTLIRKQDFLQYGKNRVEMEFGMEDYDMWISLAEHSCFGVCIPEYLSLYRVRKDSMARGFNKNNMLYLTELITKNHKKLYQEYGDEIYNISLANGAMYLQNNPSFFPVDLYTMEQLSSFSAKPSIRDILWRYRVWRGFIKVLHATKITAFYKWVIGKGKKS